MAKIRGSVALALTFLNLFGAIALLSLSSVTLDKENDYYGNDNDGGQYYIRKLSQIENLHSNLRGTKIRAIRFKELIQQEIFNKNKIKTTIDYNQDEFVIPKKTLKKSSSQKIRKLESNFKNDDKIIYILLLSCLSICFTFLLMFSFCLDTNECCNREAQDELGMGCCIYCLCCDCHCESSGSRGGDCNCSGGNNNDGAAALLILLIVIVIFVLLYFAVKACGKHVSRYVAITCECLLNLAMMVLAIMYTLDDPQTDNGFIFIGISGILFACNFLGVLLPNLSCCLNLRYGYRPTPTNMNTPILEQPAAKTNINQEPIYLPPSSSPTPVIETNPVVQPTVPIYVPQVPQPQAAPPSIYQNNPTYQPQAPPPPYQQPSSDFYNSGQGGIYNYPPPAYDQPQSIYQAQLPNQQELYGQIPKPQ